MSVRTITCYVIHCDGEGCDLRYDNGEYQPHHESAEGIAEEVADDEAWVERDGKHYCYRCVNS